MSRISFEGERPRKKTKAEIEKSIKELEEKLSKLSRQLSTKKKNTSLLSSMLDYSPRESEELKMCFRCGIMFEGYSKLCSKCKMKEDTTKISTAFDEANQYMLTRVKDRKLMNDPNLLQYRLGNKNYFFNVKLKELAGQKRKIKPSKFKKIMLKIGFANEVKKNDT